MKSQILLLITVLNQSLNGKRPTERTKIWWKDEIKKVMETLRHRTN